MIPVVPMIVGTLLVLQVAGATGWVAWGAYVLTNFQVLGRLSAAVFAWLFAVRGRVKKAALGFRSGIDILLDLDNWLREHPLNRNPKARISGRYVSLLRYVCGWRDPFDPSRGYDAIVIVAHSQGTVITADIFRFLLWESRGDLPAYDPSLAPLDDIPVTLFTMGCPLRDLYALRFPRLYAWARHEDPAPMASWRARDLGAGRQSTEPNPADRDVGLVNASRERKEGRGRGARRILCAFAASAASVLLQPSDVDAVRRERAFDDGRVGGILDADEDQAVGDRRIVERRRAPHERRGHEQRSDRGKDAAEHRQLEHHDQVGPPRDDRHVAGRQRPRELGHAREPCGGGQADDRAAERDPSHPRRVIVRRELVLLERLGRDDGDPRVADAGRAQAVDGALRRFRRGEQSVHRAHGRTSPMACSACCSCGSRTACSPTFSSQTEMMGTNFANSV